MLITKINLLDFLNQKLETVSCQNDTKAYITSIFKRYTSAEFDFSQESVTLLYAEARERQDFSGFQNIGDWLFFSESMFPASLNGASEDYYHTLARSSYYRCYTLISRKWRLFEELSDNYQYLVTQTKTAMAPQSLGLIPPLAL